MCKTKYLGIVKSMAYKIRPHQWSKLRKISQISGLIYQRIFHMEVFGEIFNPSYN